MNKNSKTKVNTENKRSSEVLLVIEKLLLVVLYIGTLGATALFAFGITTYGKQEVNVFSAINLILQVLETGSKDTFSCITDCLVGTVFIALLVASISICINCSKKLISAFSRNAGRQHFKNALNFVMNKYYRVMAHVVCFLVFGRLFTPLQLKGTTVLYLSLSLALFVAAYVIRLLDFEKNKRKFTLNVLSIVLFFFATLASLYIIDGSLVTELIYNFNGLLSLEIEMNGKLFFMLAYSYVAEVVLFIMTVLVLMYATAYAFNETTENDTYFFGLKGASKKIITFAIIIIVCRIVIDLFIQNTGAVDVENMERVFNVIFERNKADALPLLFLGITMRLSSSED